jgi:RimJ/RimL family protein N-acetyltransferase
LAIELKDTGEVIGCIGYLLPFESNIGIGDNDAEVGYWVARPYWNQGICTEALRLIVDYCFKDKGFRNLWGDFFEDNPPPGRVMTKCGFQETGDMSYCSHLYGGNDSPVKIMKMTCE